MQDKLQAALARVVGRKQAVGEMRSKLKVRAGEQLDTMGGCLQTVRDHIHADEHGGCIGHQYHRARLQEREELARMAHG
jgi:hypothetical protein